MFCFWTSHNYRLFSDIETFNGTSWQQGSFPAFPYPVYDHCMVMLNESAFMSIGGLNFTTGSAGKSTNRLVLNDLNKIRF
jgi:hypothetical protein